MKRFTVKTLVDITETQQYRRDVGKELEREQQQNFQMLIQTIGMRVNPIYHSPPSCKAVPITSEFGNKYKGTHNVWTFCFDIEYDDGLTDNNGNEAGLLINDLHLVPFTPSLKETIKIVIPVFDTQTVEFCNTVIYPYG